MSRLVIAPLVVALVGVVVMLALGRRPRLQRTASGGIGVSYAATVAVAVWSVVLSPGAPGATAYQVGGWPAPFGITLILDGLSAFMLVITATIGLATLVFSLVSIDQEVQRVHYHPLFHVLLLGVTGAFLTGDLFNLFVWFEVMLLSSYIFVAFYGEGRHTAASFRYLVLNVVGSALMLLGVGGLYAVTGTLNMADMSRRLADPMAFGIEVTPVIGLTALLLAVFALKAGLVPFQFWVPEAYTAAPLPVTAMFAGVTKKVGIYAIVRLYFTVFGGMSLQIDIPVLPIDSPHALLASVLLGMGVASILIGGLGAVSRETVEETFAYSSVGQVGFIAIPVAIGAASAGFLQRLALAAAFVYILHHSLAKGMLFLVAASISNAIGTNRVADLGGLSRCSPVLAGSFFVGVLSLIGLPPLAGFFGKFLVFDAAVRQYATTGGGTALTTLLVLLTGAVLTIIYATRLWTRIFWGTETPAVQEAVFDGRELTVIAVLAATVVLVGVGFEPVYEFAETAATAALDQEGYVDIVDPVGGVST
ncbi:complex I subunit 5 family protein [Halalkalicoccus salilacus]|uniref:complex I subunit 5 family protein n=1 Tax=Halalkalicoccus salilacus TaxID=3117459 RepID=UPI00300E7206